MNEDIELKLHMNIGHDPMLVLIDAGSKTSIHVAATFDFHLEFLKIDLMLVTNGDIKLNLQMNIDNDSGMAFILRLGPWVDAFWRYREGTGIYLCGCGRPTGLVKSCTHYCSCWSNQ